MLNYQPTVTLVQTPQDFNGEQCVYKLVFCFEMNNDTSTTIFNCGAFESPAYTCDPASGMCTGYICKQPDGATGQCP